jgi:AP-3 complex subunit mu
MTTEPNALKAMVAPPSLLNKVVQAVTNTSSIAETVDEGMLTNIPWRKAKVRYTQNEVYFDIVEELDCIIDANGQAVTCEVLGALG